MLKISTNLRFDCILAMFGKCVFVKMTHYNNQGYNYHAEKLQNVEFTIILSDKNTICRTTKKVGKRC